MGTQTLKRFASGILASVVTVSVIAPAILAKGGTNEAVSYLQTKPINVWSAQALAVAGKTVDVSSLVSLDAATAKAIDYQAPILAMVAAGKNPTTYPAFDFVAKLKTFWDGTQLGDAGTVNDDIFGALALLSAGVSKSDAVLSGLKSYIVARQNNDGGFPFAVAGTSDTNTTAAAIMSLLKLDVSKTDQVIVKAISYLKSAQNDDGGFPYDPQSQWGTDSDASSDAWVVMTINALGESASDWTKNGKTPVDHLLSLQDATSGYFAWQSGFAEDSFSPVTAAYAVIALSGKSFPVAVYTAPVFPHVSYRLVGSQNDCIGETEAPNPLETAKKAAAACGMDYHVTEYSFGDYLDRIGSDSASGNKGWSYYVNAVEGNLGADAYSLKANDEVLWVFTDFGSSLSRISVDSSSIASGGSASVTVEYLDGGVWKKLSGASVHAGNTLVTSNENGVAVLTLPDGSYKVYARKDGIVRSEAKTLTFGARTEGAVDLSVDLGTGSGGGSGNSSSGNTISFVLSPAAAGSNGVSFGQITKGQNVTKEVNIENKSSLAMYFEAIVTGDKVFTSYLTIDDAPWRKFNSKLNSGAARTLSVGLIVPTEYQDGGTKNGKLTIWAGQAN